MKTEPGSETVAADPSSARRVLLDLRIYTLATGKLREYLDLYAREGLPVQVRHLGRPFGYFVSETGPQDQVVHLWAYASAADRERRRAGLAADPAWLAFVGKTGSFFRHRETRLVESAPFWPVP